MLVSIRPMDGGPTKEMDMTKLNVVLGCFFVAMGAQAALVAGWDINGIDVNDGAGLDASGAPYVFSATTSETERVSAELTLGDGVNPSTSSNQYGFKISTADATNSLAGAIASEHYLEFALTVSGGYALNIDSIEMNGGGSSTACSNVVLLSSIGGFTSEQDDFSAYPANQTGGFDAAAGNTNGFDGPLVITSAPYSNLTGTISFRLYGWNSTSGSGATYLRNLSGDDLVVNGTVVQLSTSAGPKLSVVSSNGTTSVSAAFEGAASDPYILQYRDDLTDSNGWSNVSAPFASNAVWQILLTNSAGFYRAIAD
jgi:hypothetical protein